MSAGVLNQEQIRELTRGPSPRIICDQDIDVGDDKVDTSAIDIPLGEKYWVMTASCRGQESKSIKQLIKDYSEKHCTLEKGTVLECKKTYLFSVPWSLDLGKNLCARATAKSSVGRLDAFVRLIADKEHEYDLVNADNMCDLYLEVRPNTFPIKVRPGQSLSQIRFLRGNERHCTIPLEELKYESEFPLVDKHGQNSEIKSAANDSDSVLLRLDLSDDETVGAPGFVAKDDTNMRAIDPSLKNRYDPRNYWDLAQREDKRNSIKIIGDRFYIFRSKERFCLPPHLAVDCRAVSESLGDIRIHYAGFAHPYFGYKNKKGNGAPLIFEVRGYQFDTILHDGTPLAKVFFRRMSKPAPLPKKKAKRKKKYDYSNQELKLSKCFKPWTK